ncbi:uncharacterized protein M6B38_328575 [Iris pallida]|uniref:Uncharacterized protein n=1 Tax=Iris pallida TaxID=29817 RepID=A0AAX6H606_IRIPA|nr:uncharacterized protein M6B38_328575 [Iris pallida]
MKLVWCPETSSKAYIEAVKALSVTEHEDADVAELVAALAGGWKAQLIVEAWASGSTPATSVSLSAATKHTQGRHVCIVPDDRSALEYATVSSAETKILVGEAEEVMGEADGIDFMVVDFRRKDAGRLMREARAGPRGMVVVCKNVERRGGALLGKGMRLVRSLYLPIGRGVEILHVGVGKGPKHGGGSCNKWIKHVDEVTGEVHFFRK